MNATLDPPPLRSRERALFAALLLAAIAPFWVNGYVNSLIADTPALYWTFELLSWFVIPALVAWAAHRYLGITWAQVGVTRELFGRRRPLLLAMMCIACAFAFYAVYAAADAWFSRVFTGSPYFDYQTLIPEAGPARFVLAAYYALTAGVVEEVLYRGALFRLLQGLRGATALYLLLSPVIFSSIHWEGGASNLAATWVVGLFAAVLMLAFRNVLPLIAGHVATDFAWFT